MGAWRNLYRVRGICVLVDFLGCIDHRFRIMVWLQQVNCVGNADCDDSKIHPAYLASCICVVVRQAQIRAGLSQAQALCCFRL